MSPPLPDTPILPLSQYVSAKRAEDATALAEALDRLRGDRPSFVYAPGGEPGTFRIDASTPGELARHIAELTAQASVPVEYGTPIIQPCWTPGRVAEAEHRLGSSDGGTGDFAVVRLRIVPRRSGEGNLFETEFAGPPEIDGFNAAVARGVARIWAEGPNKEGRIIDTRVVFIDGAFHSSRSTPDGFEQAAVIAMQDACRTAGLRRLEPLMEIEILADRDLVLPIVNDLAPRGGSELRRRLAQKGVVIVAELPLRSLLTYEDDLAASTQGRAKFLGEARLTRWAEARRR